MPFLLFGYLNYPPCSLPGYTKAAPAVILFDPFSLGPCNRFLARRYSDVNLRCRFFFFLAIRTFFFSLARGSRFYGAVLWLCSLKPVRDVSHGVGSLLPHGPPPPFPVPLYCLRPPPFRSVVLHCYPGLIPRSGASLWRFVVFTAYPKSPQLASPFSIWPPFDSVVPVPMTTFESSSLRPLWCGTA